MAKIAILLEQKYEDLELQYPRLRLKEAGHTVEVIAPKVGEKYIGKWGYPQAADKASKDATARSPTPVPYGIWPPPSPRVLPRTGRRCRGDSTRRWWCSSTSRHCPQPWADS